MRYFRVDISKHGAEDGDSLYRVEAYPDRPERGADGEKDRYPLWSTTAEKATIAGAAVTLPDAGSITMRSKWGLSVDLNGNGSEDYHDYYIAKVRRPAAAEEE